MITEEEDDDPRKILHKYLTTAAGAPLKFLRMLDEPCPDCGRGPKPNKLAVLFENPIQETVHCVSCDYQTTRKPTRTSRTFRPMNSGNRPQ